MNPTGYGAALRAARKSLGLSVAKASDIVKLSPATIKRWESSQGLPPKSELRGYLDRLGVPDTSPVREAIESEQSPSGFRESRELLTNRPVLRLLRSKRRRNGITLTELSEATGLSVASLYRYETGERAPDEPVLRSLANAVGCSEAETDGLCQSLFEPVPPTDTAGLVEQFLIPGNLSQLRVFSLLDTILLQKRPVAAEPWDAFHGLLIMGEHETVREVWPVLKPALASGELSFEDRVLIRTTLAMVRSTFEVVDSSTIRQLRSGVMSLKPGLTQVMAMLHLARLATAIGDTDEAESWVRAVEEYGLRVEDPGTLFLAELNRHAIEFEDSRSLSAVAGVETLRANAEGALQAYNADVALAHMRSILGDALATVDALESCAEAEATFGFGSPLAKKVRRKQPE